MNRQLKEIVPDEKKATRLLLEEYVSTVGVDADSTSVVLGVTKSKRGSPYDKFIYEGRALFLGSAGLVDVSTKSRHPYTTSEQPAAKPPVNPGNLDITAKVRLYLYSDIIGAKVVCKSVSATTDLAACG